MSSDPSDDKMIGNERAKLTATYVNGIAIAIFAVGGLAPLVSAITPKSPADASGPAALHALPWEVLGITTFCWVASGALHWAARTSLKELRA